MNKQELIASLAEHADVNKRQAEAVLSSLTTIIQEKVSAAEEITIPGIGKFTAGYRAARKGRNPATGAEIDIPTKCIPKFSAAQALKDAALTD